MILAVAGGDSAGPLGLLIVILLGIGTVLLVRNMTGRIKKLPTTFEDRDKHGRPLDQAEVSRPESDESASGPTSGA